MSSNTANRKRTFSAFASQALEHGTAIDSDLDQSSGQPDQGAQRMFEPIHMMPRPRTTNAGTPNISSSNLQSNLVNVHPCPAWLPIIHARDVHPMQSTFPAMIYGGPFVQGQLEPRKNYGYVDLTKDEETISPMTRPAKPHFNVNTAFCTVQNEFVSPSHAELGLVSVVDSTIDEQQVENYIASKDWSSVLAELSAQDQQLMPSDPAVPAIVADEVQTVSYSSEEIETAATTIEQSMAVTNAECNVPTVHVSDPQVTQNQLESPSADVHLPLTTIIAGPLHSESTTPAETPVPSVQTVELVETEPQTPDNWVGGKLYLQGVEIGSISARGLKLMKPVPKVTGPLLGQKGFEQGHLNISKPTKVDLRVGGVVGKEDLENYNIHINRAVPCKETCIVLSNGLCTVTRDGREIYRRHHESMKGHRNLTLKPDGSYEVVPPDELLEYEDWRDASKEKLSDGMIRHLEAFPRLPRQVNRCENCLKYKDGTGSTIGYDMGACEHDIDHFLYMSRSARSLEGRGVMKLYELELARFGSVKWHLVVEAEVRSRAEKAGAEYVRILRSLKEKMRIRIEEFQR